MKKFLLKILILTLVPLLVFAAPDKTQERTDYEVFKAKTEANIEALKTIKSQELIKFESELEAQKSLTNQINNQVGAFGNNLTTGSAIITILLLLIGFFTYRNARSDAKETAQTEAKAWFEKNTKELNQDLDTLRKKLKALEEEAKRHVTDLKRNTTLEASKYLREFTNPHHMVHVNGNNQLISLKHKLQNKNPSEYTYDDWHTLAYITAVFNKNPLKASHYWQKASTVVDATDVEVAEALFNQAFSLQEGEKFQQAIGVYEDILNRFSKKTDSKFPTILLRSAVNLGQAYDAIGKYDFALETFDVYLNEYSDLIKFPGIEGEVASALIGKAIIYGRKGFYNKEIECYQKVIDDFKGSKSEIVLDMVAHAMYYKGMSYSEFNDYESAINSFDEVINQYSNSNSEVLLKGVTMALNYKAYALILKAKLNYKNVQLREKLLNNAIVLLNEALSSKQNSDTDIAIQKGNLAYAQWLLDENKQKVIDILKEALQLGGEKLYMLTLGGYK